MANLSNLLVLPPDITTASNTQTLTNKTVGLNSSWHGNPVEVSYGGTGASTAADARTNLGVVIGTDVQAYDADLAAIAGLAGTSGLLKKTAANTWSLDTSTYLPLTGGTVTGGITLSTASPVMYWHETAQTLPAGRRRMVADGNSLRIDYNTAAAGDYSTYTTHLTTDSSGNLTASGNVGAYSDERLKSDWQDLPQDFIEQLAKVKHGTYTRTDTSVRQVGVSAQSLQQILPEAIQDGEYLSVAYGNAALAAVVQLSRRVLELEAKLAKLMEQ